jgi:hypothetical protein
MWNHAFSQNEAIGTPCCLTVNLATRQRMFSLGTVSGIRSQTKSAIASATGCTLLWGLRYDDHVRVCLLRRSAALGVER